MSGHRSEFRKAACSGTPGALGTDAQLGPGEEIVSERHVEAVEFVLAQEQRILHRQVLRPQVRSVDRPDKRSRDVRHQLASQAPRQTLQFWLARLLAVRCPFKAPQGLHERPGVEARQNLFLVTFRLHFLRHRHGWNGIDRRLQRGQRLLRIAFPRSDPEARSSRL